MASPAPASASPARAVALSWVRLEGAEACVGGAALAAAVRERVGEAALFAAPDRAERIVEGYVAKVPGAFVATFRVTGADGRVLGERQLRVAGSDCQALTRPAVFVLAVILTPDPERETGDALSQDRWADLDASLAALPGEPPSPAIAPAAPAGTEAAAPTAAVEGTGPSQRAGDADTPEADRVRVGLRVAIAGEVGALPAPAPAAAVGVVVDAPHLLRLVLEGGVSAVQEVRRDAQGAVSGQPGAEVRLQLQPLWVAVMGCPADNHRAGFAGVICVRASATRLGLTLQGPSSLRSLAKQRWLAEAGIRVGARRRWSGLAVWAELGFGVALRRDTLQFLERSGSLVTLYRPGPVNVGAHLGMEITF